MPNGFWYAGGDSHIMRSAIASSAFSKGDLLLLDSSSSLSRMPWASSPGMAITDIAGIALADSDSSIDDLVSYIAPGPDTLFWASTQSNLGTTLAPGLECDVNFDTGNNRYYVDPASTNTVRVVLMDGDFGVGAVSQSVQSKVLCKLIYHAGNLDLS